MTPLLQPGTRIPDDRIFELEKDRFNSLLHERRLVLTDREMEHNILDDPREVKDLDLCLVLRELELDERIDCAYSAVRRGSGVPRAYEDLRFLCQSIRFARYDEATRSLLMEGEVSLMDELMRLIGVMTGPPSLVVVEVREAAELLERDGWFAGLSSICSCGDWQDSSEFSWIENRREIVRLITDCGCIWAIDVLPAPE